MGLSAIETAAKMLMKAQELNSELKFSDLESVQMVLNIDTAKWTFILKTVSDPIETIHHVPAADWDVVKRKDIRYILNLQTANYSIVDNYSRWSEPFDLVGLVNRALNGSELGPAIIKPEHFLGELGTALKFLTETYRIESPAVRAVTPILDAAGIALQEHQAFQAPLAPTRSI